MSRKQLKKRKVTITRLMNLAAWKEANLKLERRANLPKPKVLKLPADISALLPAKTKAGN